MERMVRMAMTEASTPRLSTVRVIHNIPRVEELEA
jgi:hypothetical protein